MICELINGNKLLFTKFYCHLQVTILPRGLSIGDTYSCEVDLFLKLELTATTSSNKQTKIHENFCLMGNKHLCLYFQSQFHENILTRL